MSTPRASSGSSSYPGRARRLSRAGGSESAPDHSWSSRRTRRIKSAKPGQNHWSRSTSTSRPPPWRWKKPPAWKVKPPPAAARRRCKARSSRLPALSGAALRQERNLLIVHRHKREVIELLLAAVDGHLHAHGEVDLGRRR